jgi:hypothetical protein
MDVMNWDENTVTIVKPSQQGGILTGEIKSIWLLGSNRNQYGGCDLVTVIRATQRIVTALSRSGDG